MKLRCRLFGHRWRTEYAYSGRWITVPTLLSFGFQCCMYPMPVPERTRIVGVSCERCGEPEPRYTITPKGRAILEGK